MSEFNLNYDIGLDKLYLNDTETFIEFNGHDLNFYNRYYKFCDSMDKIVERLNFKDEKEVSVIYQKISEIGDDINKQFDDVFGESAHKLAFRGINPLTLTKPVSKKKSPGMLIVNFLDGTKPYIDKCYKEFIDWTAQLGKKYTDILSEFDDETGETKD